MSEVIDGVAQRETAPQLLPAGAPPDAPKPPLLPPAWRREELSSDDGGLAIGPHWLLGGIIGFVVVAVAWAAIGEIDEITRGEGRVITSSQTQTVQNLEGGIVSKILVKEGEHVQQGQVLFQLDDLRFASAYQEGAQGALALKAKVARLTAEVQKTALVMPPEVLKQARGLADNEISVHQARLRDLAAKNATLQEQLVQRKQELIELESRRERLAEQSDLLRREITITSPLVKQGAVSEVEVLRLERDSARIRQDLDGAVLSIPRVRAAIEEAKRKMEDNETAFRSEAASQLSVARGELAKVDETVPALEDRVARTQVRAPVNGIVKVIPNKTPGSVVQPGATLAEMVPVDDALVVEAHIRPQDIAFVSVGQSASVKLAAYDYSIYGGMPGKVVSISPDSIQPQTPGPAQEPYYIAHVRTQNSALEYRGKLLPVIPGMTATVDVLTGRRTILYYLLKPINKARGRALTER